MENSNIMDIASEQMSDEQISNMGKLAASPERQEIIDQEMTDLENALKGIQTYDFRNKVKQVVRVHEKVNRNSPCPCGSGKKYKNCCLNNGEYEGYVHK